MAWCDTSLVPAVQCVSITACIRTHHCCTKCGLDSLCRKLRFRCVTGPESKQVCSAGAFGLDGSLLTGRTLLNLDTEDWGEIFIGCAGEQLNSASFAGYTVP